MFVRQILCYNNLVHRFNISMPWVSACNTYPLKIWYTRIKLFVSVGMPQIFSTRLPIKWYGKNLFVFVRNQFCRSRMVCHKIMSNFILKAFENISSCMKYLIKYLQCVNTKHQVLYISWKKIVLILHYS